MRAQENFYDSAQKNFDSNDARTRELQQHRGRYMHKRISTAARMIHAQESFDSNRMIKCETTPEAPKVIHAQEINSTRTMRAQKNFDGTKNGPRTSEFRRLRE
ncbi:hypothetical protein PoB_006991100 [Plakobranchus ocellatus]|uniref:Uncharacterized protein n=1 Tax=Plakobranchus ocellatus TaxID=259542 RepID=A0AAV4DGY3_9GAST|nr:hypothetical protein PoB_006991100 [Plakobranchus ocellatus]